MIKRRSTPATKWTVLGCVIENGNLPFRSLARFCAVSRTVKKMVTVSTTPPVYAGLVEDLATRLDTNDTMNMKVFFADSAQHGVDIKVGRRAGKKVYKVEVGRLTDVKWERIVVCAPQNFRAMMYRALERNKVLKKAGVGVRELLADVAVEYNGVIRASAELGFKNAVVL